MFSKLQKFWLQLKDKISSSNNNEKTIDGPRPKHVAVIMDGNGRWAQKKGLIRTKGHQQGVNTLKEVISLAQKMNLKYFTAYAFSTENWKRPEKEVEFLMDLFEKTFEQEVDDFKEENIKVNVIGYKDRLPDSVIEKIDKITTETKNNTGLTVNIALDYGGRAELIEGVKEFIADCQNNKVKFSDLDENKFSEYLYTAGQPDVDLLIRPGGEKRISNFLLWQLAYAELYFTDTYWPEFSEDDFRLAISEYQNRNRRFGAIKGK